MTLWIKKLPENQVQEITQMLERSHPELFSDVEQSLSDPVDEKIINRYREKAKNAAIKMALRKINNGEEINIPVEVAALYRENLENPSIMEVDEASKVRS